MTPYCTDPECILRWGGRHRHEPEPELPSDTRVQRFTVVRSRAGWTPDLVEYVRNGGKVVWR